jgi:hypothetical protein
VNLVPVVFSSGWASGVNAYLVVLVLGLSDRWGHFEQIPDQLARTDVLVAAAVLFAGEFVADKVPYLDSTWDAVSTVIRPTVAAAIALLVSGEATNLEQAGYAVLGGSTALASHSVKAGSRLAINSSPEPISNWAASLAEDGVVVAVALLVIHHPWIALTITVTLLVLGLTLLFWLVSRVRRGWRRWKGRPVSGTT